MMVLVRGTGRPSTIEVTQADWGRWTVHVPWPDTGRPMASGFARMGKDRGQRRGSGYMSAYGARQSCVASDVSWPASPPMHGRVGPSSLLRPVVACYLSDRWRPRRDLGPAFAPDVVLPLVGLSAARDDSSATPAGTSPSELNGRPRRRRGAGILITIASSNGRLACLNGGPCGAERRHGHHRCHKEASRRRVPAHPRTCRRQHVYLLL